MTVRILVADDHPLVLTGLRRVLEKEQDFEVVAEATDGAEAVEKAADGVDLAIVDIAMPRLTGLQATEQLARRSPNVRVLILSMYGSEQMVLAAARAGARGFVVKSMADEEIVAACRAVINGEEFSCPASASERLRDLLARGAGKGPDDILTPRESEVVKLVAEGHTSDEIAAMLVLSVKTVERHRSNIAQKLGVRGNAGMIRYAIRAGLVEP